MKSSTSVVELVMLLCSQVSFSLPLSPAPHHHPLSFLPIFVVMTPWKHVSTSEEKKIIGQLKLDDNKKAN